MSEDNAAALSTPTPDASSRSFRVFAITSGKGGVGKSSILLNLGISFSNQGRKVLLIDGDLGLGNVDVLLDETSQFTLQHVIAGEQPIDKVLLRSRYGPAVLPATSGVAEVVSLSETERMRLVESMDDLGDEFDTILVDTPAGIGSNALFFASAAQEVVVVVTPEPTSLADAYAMIKLLSLRCGVKRIGVITNQVASDTEAREVFRKLSTITNRFLPAMVELVGVVPADPHVREAVKLQQPVVSLYPQAKSSLAIKRLAEELLMRPTRQTGASGRLQLFWRQLMQVENDGQLRDSSA